MNAAELTQRIERVEATIAHMERQSDELNSVIIEQGRTITRLVKRLEQLGDTLETQELDRVRSTQQKPPHWTV